MGQSNEKEVIGIGMMTEQGQVSPNPTRTAERDFGWRGVFSKGIQKVLKQIARLRDDAKHGRGRGIRIGEVARKRAVDRRGRLREEG